jgi:hypothetical protein
MLALTIRLASIILKYFYIGTLQIYVVNLNTAPDPEPGS